MWKTRGQEGEGKYLLGSPSSPNGMLISVKRSAPLAFQREGERVCVCVWVKRSDAVFWPFGALSEVLQVNNCTQGSITKAFTTAFTTRRRQRLRDSSVLTALSFSGNAAANSKTSNILVFFIVY